MSHVWRHNNIFSHHLGPMIVFNSAEHNPFSLTGVSQNNGPCAFLFGPSPRPRRLANPVSQEPVVPRFARFIHHFAQWSVSRWIERALRPKKRDESFKIQFIFPDLICAVIYNAVQPTRTNRHCKLYETCESFFYYKSDNHTFVNFSNRHCMFNNK